MQSVTCTRQARRAGQTCIELLVVVLGIVAGVVLASYLHGRWGWIGIPIGFIGGSGAWIGVIALVNEIIDWISPTTPTCKCGNKGPRSYTLQEMLQKEDGRSDGCIEVCKKCGARYLFKNWRFQEILPDGSFRPYMIRKAGIGWRLDDHLEPWPPAPKTE